MEEAVANNILSEASQIIENHTQSQDVMSSQFMITSEGLTSPPAESTVA